MRYLGKKTKLLADIERVAQSIGFNRGTVVDLFAGSGTVGQYFRSKGCRVLSTDLMHSSFIYQKLFLELDGLPTFDQLRKEMDFKDCSSSDSQAEQELTEVEALHMKLFAFLLNELEPREHLVSRQFCPSGRDKRMFFSEGNAGRIDSILLQIKEWQGQDWIDELEAIYLIAVTMDAADRVANISGTYAAYLKKWQVNALQKMQLRIPHLVSGPIGKAHREDALTWVQKQKADIAYLDPPYNHRQYAANYHLMEILARIPFEEDLQALEDSIYGVAGLIPWTDRKSKLCSRKGDECCQAFNELLANLKGVSRLVLSYSEEGILSKEQILDSLAQFSGVAVSKLGKVLHELSYKRFRSDADGRIAHTGSTRSYQHLEGRERDELREWIFAVEKR